MGSGLEGKTLGILLATGPENSNSWIVTEIAEAATALGIKVEIFLMDQGIYNLIDDRFKKLTTSGVDISFCSLNAEQKKITGITIGRTGSQLDHAEIVKKCDRYLGFFR